MKTQITVRPHKTHVKEVHMIPIGYNDHSLGQSSRPHATGSKIGPIALLILCIAIVAFILMRLENPPASVKAAKLELEKVLAQERMEEARKQALKNEILAKCSTTEAKLDDLEQERQAIDSEFLSLCEVPLDQAHMTMSRKMTHSALQVPAFLEALTLLINSQFPKTSFSKQRDTIQRVAGNVSANSIVVSHIETLDEVLIWIDDKHQVLQLQRSMLDQLRQSSL